jgi:hypothetical protein
MSAVARQRQNGTRCYRVATLTPADPSRVANRKRNGRQATLVAKWASGAHFGASVGGEAGVADRGFEVSFAGASFEGPVPRTTKHPLEEPGGGTSGCGDVFDEAVAATRAQDATDLGQDVSRVGHAAQHE